MTGSSGLLMQRRLPVNSAGCASKMEPVCSDIFLMFAKYRYASLEIANWLTSILYSELISSAFLGMNRMGLSLITSADNFVDEPSRIVFDRLDLQQ